jgi:hypothetical protein
MPNQHKATKIKVPARIEKSELAALRKLARERKMKLPEFLKKIALGEIPLGDE